VATHGGSATIYGKNKEPTTIDGEAKNEQDLGDIVRDDTVKTIESTNNVPDDVTSLDNDKEDLGDLVRDDTTKSVHLGEDASAPRNKQSATSSPFSMDGMILESATDSTNDDEDLDEEDYYYYDSEDDMKRQILGSALEFVPEHGWTDLALQKGAEAQGLSSAIEGLFPRGPGDLVLHFIEECNGKLAEQLLEESKINNELPGAPDIPKRSTTSFIQEAIILRLNMLQPYIHTWPQAMRLLMHPENAPAALESLAHMVDEVWYHAGDTSTDFNWYTKRGGLAAIYGASEAVMTRDRSPDFKCTKQFVQDSLENAEKFKQAAVSMEGVANSACNGLSLLVSTARNMLGFNERRR